MAVTKQENILDCSEIASYSYVQFEVFVSRRLLCTSVQIAAVAGDQIWKGKHNTKF